MPFVHYVEGDCQQNLSNNIIECLLGARHCLCVIIIAVQEMCKKYLELISSWGDHEKYKTCYMVICIMENNGAGEGSREFLGHCRGCYFEEGKAREDQIEKVMFWKTFKEAVSSNAT